MITIIASAMIVIIREGPLGRTDEKETLDQKHQARPKLDLSRSEASKIDLYS
jgi:hypothetical protein